MRRSVAAFYIPAFGKSKKRESDDGLRAFFVRFFQTGQIESYQVRNEQ